MITWLSTNIVLTVLALVFLRLHAGTPHRFRFFVAFIASCCWLVPWNQIGRIVPSISMVPSLSLSESYRFLGGDMPAATSVDVPAGLIETITSNLDAIFFALTCVGVLLFVASSIRYWLLLRRLSNASTNADYLWNRLTPEWQSGPVSQKAPEIRIQERVPGAMTTGVWRPIVWVHTDLAQDRCLTAALMHEYHHARNRDNAYLWVITLVEKLNWWNPLARHLASRVRRLLELSCDEVCSRNLPDYREMLNGLVFSLAGADTNACAQASCIHHSKNFNIVRLRALERRYTMTIRHYASTAILAGAALFSIGWTQAQESPEPTFTPEKAPQAASIEERLQAIEEATGEAIGPINGLEPGTTLDEAERMLIDLRVYVALLERQYAQQETAIESLRRQVEALGGETPE